MADQESLNTNSSNVRQEFNLGRIGLNLDNTPNQIEKGKLTYALNAALENFDANSVNYQNESGNEFCLDFPDGFVSIGDHFIGEQNKHMFFLVNPNTGDSQIGYMDNNDCVYVTYIDSPCLNFNINNPIQKSVHRITNCTTELYWTDGLNPRRFLDLQNIPYITTYPGNICEPIVTKKIDCNKLKIQPNFSIPGLSINSIINGGNLAAGTYQFSIQYCSAQGDAYTSYYSVTNPTPIANPQLTTANYDYPVGKSIVIDISNIDITGYFKYYNIAVISTVNNIQSVQLVGTYFIDGATKQITYSGQNVTQIPLSVSDIIEKHPYYDVAQDVTNVQDVLIWDNLISNKRVNYQQIANKITLQWQTYRIPNTETYADSLNATNLRGYLRDEVYAFEIVFLLRNGRQTDSFHIPGRAYTSSDIVTVNKSTNDDYIGTGTVAPYWKIYNTGYVTDFAPQYISALNKSTYKGPYQYGEFSYWESTEVYPCNPIVWGELADKPIRHHKFPDVSISPIIESPNPNYTNLVMQNNAIFPIGVKIDSQQIAQLIFNSDLPQEEKDEVVGYKIIRGDRATNKSIIAKGILRNVGKYTRDTTINNPTPTYYYYPNYPYNDLEPDPFLLSQNNAYNAQCITYSISVTAGGNGTIQYTDCNTNELIVVTLDAALTSLCSTTYPVILSGSAVITNNSSFSYTLASYVESPFTSTTFTYTAPGIGGTFTIVVHNDYPEIVNAVSPPVYQSGSKKYIIIENNNGENAKCYPSELNGFGTDSQYRMVFNSPETSFGQPTLGGVIKLESAMFGAGRAHFVKVKNHALYKLISKQAQVDALNSSYNIANLTGTLSATAMFTAYQAYIQIYINGITRQNFAYSFNSIASYDYSATIDNGLGVKQRELELYQYLIPGVQSVGDNYNVNNFDRESSVYLKTPSTVGSLPFANKTPNLMLGGQSLVSDVSRFTISQKNTCAFPEQQEDISVVSYYGSLKNIFVNQWGQIYSYNTVDTGFQRSLISGLNTDTIFGGDTFITRFAFKTKLPFFIDNRVGAPDDSDVFYDEIGNIAYPQYWYSARSILSDYQAGPSASGTLLKNIISIKAHNLDCPNDQAPAATTSTTTTLANGATTISSTITSYTGKFYLFAYGIPNFYVESSINVDLRQAFNNQEGDFYPHVSTGIPDNWLQQSFVPIAFDNTYNYNVTYSGQNKDNYFSNLPIDWDGDQCYTYYPFRAIYSDSQADNPDVRVNAWLNYKPISFFDFPQNYGALTSLDGIQNKAILARFENKSLLYNTMLTMNTSNPQAAYLGNPSLFRSAPPIDFAETDLGYMGSQHKFLLKIPNGQISIDAKRGQVFLISGNQALDLSGFGSGLNRFFTDHLAFEILRYFPNADIDNNYNGPGLHGVYDSKFDRVIISKLDYVPQVSQIGKIFYDATLGEYYVNETFGTTVLRHVIALTDVDYFCNKSWTLSFNMNTRSWVSFHSYIPNWYIAENNFFYSGLNEGCDLEAMAAVEIPTPTTTTTTTAIPLNCNLSGTAVYVADPCDLNGTAQTV